MYHTGGVCIINTPSQKDLHLPFAIPEGSEASLCHLGGVCINLRHPGGQCLFSSQGHLWGVSASFCHHIQGICVLRPFWWDLPVELSIRTNTWVMPVNAGWLGTRIISCARWGPELCLAWSQLGHPLTSLAGSWIMPGGSMGTCVMLHHPTLTILAVFCFSPF